MFYAHERDVPAKYRRLTNLVGMLTRVHGVREDLVADIRERIGQGEYLTEDKLNAAIHCLLTDIMAEEERLS
ncbi:MAG: hypothetical protein ACYTGZ_17445 [Planctomycetota bacterium]|jgi:hypothetical protein